MAPESVSQVNVTMRIFALAAAAGASAGTAVLAANATAGLPCTTAALQAAVRLPHLSVASVIDETSRSLPRRERRPRSPGCRTSARST